MPERWHIRGLHLAALAGFAVSQPVFDILQRYPTFLVTHRLGSGDILLLTLLVGVGVPTCFFAAGWVTSLIGALAGRAVHLALVAILLLATLLPLIHRSGMNGVLALLLAGAAAAGVSLAYARSKTLRGYCSWLALALVVFPTLFLANASICTLAFGSGSSIISGADIESETPVVLLIFDEFPVVSLMDQNRQVDAARYPHFAALAQRAHWFRNTSTVAAYTEQAVPAILTGSYPEGDRLPHHGEYRQTLFTLLGGSYAMHVTEPITLLLPPVLEEAETEQDHSPPGFFTDLSLVYLHILLPSDFTADLPSVSEGWSDFGTDDDEVEREHRSNELATLDALRKNATASRVDTALQYISEMSAEEPRTLHVLHSMLPHNRWRHTPSGRHYCRKGLRNPGQIDDLWPEEPRYAELAWQRHLLQVELADRLLGKMIERLKEIGLYDRALLVVTADHGASFRPGASLRSLAEATHPPDILDVPLFVKLPGQQAGEVTDRHLRTIDILPTITEVLGAGRPAGIDGYSVFDESRESVAFKRARDSEGDYVEFDADPDLKYRTLDQKLALFGSGIGGSTYAVGDHRALLGQLLTELDISPGSPWSIELNRNYFRNSARFGKFVPVFITGKVGGATGSVSVVAAVNGTIEAIARAVPVGDARSEFHLLLPENSYGTGEVEIDLLVLDAAGRFWNGNLPTTRFHQKPLPEGYPTH